MAYRPRPARPVRLDGSLDTYHGSATLPVVSGEGGEPFLFLIRHAPGAVHRSLNLSAPFTREGAAITSRGSAFHFCEAFRRRRPDGYPTGVGAGGSSCTR